MSTPLISEIQIFAFNFAPRGWAQCNGQILSISLNTALFSLLGTTYGGNGQTTFALPDLRGRAALHTGSGFSLGQVAGEEAHTLIQTEMPAHNHLVTTSTAVVSQTYPGPANLWGAGAAEPGYALSANNTMAPQAIGISGSTQPHSNMAPFLALNFCIALEGIFPSRN
jgi:microcystin-dependent protein